MNGMATLARAAVEILATGVSFDDDRIVVEFNDGRTVALPLAWYPRLFDSNEAERNNWRLMGRGQGIEWPDIDEHLSAEQLALGVKAPAGGVWPGEPRKRDRAA